FTGCRYFITSRTVFTGRHFAITGGSCEFTGRQWSFTGHSASVTGCSCLFTSRSLFTGCRCLITSYSNLTAFHISSMHLTIHYLRFTIIILHVTEIQTTEAIIHIKMKSRRTTGMKEALHHEYYQCNKPAEIIWKAPSVKGN